MIVVGRAKDLASGERRAQVALVRRREQGGCCSPNLPGCFSFSTFANVKPEESWPGSRETWRHVLALPLTC